MYHYLLKHSCISSWWLNQSGYKARMASKRLLCSAGSWVQQNGYFLGVKQQQQQCIKNIVVHLANTLFPTQRYLQPGAVPFQRTTCLLWEGGAHRSVYKHVHIFARSQVCFRNLGTHLTFCRPQQHRQEMGTRLIFHLELISLNKTQSSKGSQQDKVNPKCVFIYTYVHTNMPWQRIPSLQKQTRKHWYQSLQDCWQTLQHPISSR